MSTACSTPIPRATAWHIDFPCCPGAQLSRLQAPSLHRRRCAMPQARRAGWESGNVVSTPSTAAVAAHGTVLARSARGPGTRLWSSAAVGGALPALETLARLTTPVREIRGIVNGTSGVVLEAWSQGKTRQEAIVEAQAAGFAELDPARDLSGLASADKLALPIEAAFAEWIDPTRIAIPGIQSISNPNGYKLVAP